MTDKETFAERLRRLRNNAGLSQAELAYKVDVVEITIRRWESGLRQPRMKDIQKLAEALHVTEDELLNGGPEVTWVLHVEIGNTKEDFIDLKKNTIKPEAVIITSKEGAYLKLGGDWSLWNEKELFNKLKKELERLRGAVIQNGIALGGIQV